MTPRIIHRKHREQTGSDTWEDRKTRLILWGQLGEWCLVSREGPGAPEIVHRTVLDPVPEPVKVEL